MVAHKLLAIIFSLTLGAGIHGCAPAIKPGADDQTQTGQETVPPPLPPETFGNVNTLPAKYPSTWILAYDFAFFHLLDGRVIVLDPLAETLARQYKGMFNVSFAGNIAQAATRPEIYATEIFYSRGTRGQRTDVLTIFDKTTLKAIDEVVLPGDKSFRGVPERYAVTLIDDEKILLVFNLNPGTSVTVIDIVNREILNEVDIPGCALIYPTGERGFSSLCSNGGILTTRLDASGQVVSQERLEPFFSVADAPIFERPAIIDGIAYFPSFLGDIHPVDVRGRTAVPGEPWPLVTDAERAAGWRPSGVDIIDYDSAGHFYLLMQAQGRTGSQGEGGLEVWVVDPEQKQRLRRIKLQNHGLSLAVTRDSDPLLVVTNNDMNIDVYRAGSGEFIRTISGFGQETPLLLLGAQ